MNLTSTRLRTENPFNGNRNIIAISRNGIPIRLPDDRWQHIIDRHNILTDQQPFLLLYDDEADVLYIDFYNPPKSSDDSELTDDDIVIRYDDREEIVGLTILHASQRTEPIIPMTLAA